MLKSMLKRLPMFRGFYKQLNNQFERDDFVISQLQKIPDGRRLLDAGCGSQRYRKYCGHLVYSSQDFGQYTVDQRKVMGTEGVGGTDGYDYGPLDYTGDIWSIEAPEATFDAILCTEVLEHIPRPVETLQEFARLLRPGGVLILTAPAACLRHMDPYFFSSGYSDRWYEFYLPKFGFDIAQITPVGDYYRWMAVELARTGLSHSIFSKFLVFPAFVYYYFKKPTPMSVDTLCFGYHVVARKVPLE